MKQLLIVLTTIYMMGCEDTTTGVDARCEINIVQPSEDWVRGSDVTMEAYPLSTSIDTTVLINDETLSIVHVDTNTCPSCEECREAEFCTECGYCEPCALECMDCQHQLTINIPEAFPESPEYLLSLYNGFGTSQPVSVSIIDAPN